MATGAGTGLAPLGIKRSNVVPNCAYPFERMTSMSRIYFALALGPVLLLALALGATPAQACGGLFCLGRDW